METIAAIATAPGRAGVAVVRVSGDDAFAVHERLAGRAAEPGRIRALRVCGEECVVLAFKGPRSYTGEDVVEIQCHGGIVAPRRILDACFSAGARLAGRGEFTRRAFLNGRITFEQAQAVIDLIDAKTDRAAEAALSGLANARSRDLAGVYDAILDISSVVEHALDVDEEELPAAFMGDVESRLAELGAKIGAALRRAREGEILREGALVVLAGEPNAGKSSLFNALVGDARAIVSPVAGTTRDAIEAWLDIGGWPVRLVDTAGLRDTGDVVEAEGVARAKGRVAAADVVLALSESDGDLPPPLHPWRKTLRVRSKCDIPSGASGADSPLCALAVSAVTGEGLDELRLALAAALDGIAGERDCEDGGGEDSKLAVAALRHAAVAVADALRCAGDLVLAGNCLAKAASAIAAVTGARYSADLLDRLFSRFCVGK